MAVLKIRCEEVKYVMDGPNGEMPGCRAIRYIPVFTFPDIHVKRIQTDSRSKKMYIGVGDEPQLEVEGIEGKTITINGLFAGEPAKAIHYPELAEKIFKYIGHEVLILDNAGGTIYELQKGRRYVLDSFSFDRNALKRGILEFTMILSYKWEPGEAM